MKVRITRTILIPVFLHVVLYFLVLAQLVKAVKRLAADVAHKRVEVWVVVVQSRLSLVHVGYVAISNKAVTIPGDLLQLGEMPADHADALPGDGHFIKARMRPQKPPIYHPARDSVEIAPVAVACVNPEILPQFLFVAPIILHFNIFDDFCHEHGPSYYPAFHLIYPAQEPGQQGLIVIVIPLVWHRDKMSDRIF
jgi:hypothetical protein